MASAAVYDAVRTYLTAQWSACPIAFENEPFERPMDENGVPLPWIAMEMMGTVYGQQSIGARTQAENRWDEEGQLWLHVFVASGTGSSLVRGYAKQLADLFRGTLLLSDTLEFGDASLGMGEPGDDEGAYFRVSVSVTWSRMEA